jgi:MFS family permease
MSGVGSAVGTLVAGAMSAKLGYRLTLVLLAVLDGVVMLLLIAATSMWAFYLLAAAVGFAFSATVPVRMAVVPPFFGLRGIGTIIGLTALSFSVGAIAGPFLAGYIFDSTASYHLAFLMLGSLLLAGALALQFLRAPRARGAPEQTPIWRAGDGLG